MARLLTLCLLALLLSGTARADDWTLRKDESGIQVYTRPVPGSKFKSFRGEMQVKTTLSTLMAVHADVAYIREWLKDCSKSKLLTEFDPKDYSVYFRTDSPWPVQDRDYVLRYHISQDPVSYALKITFNAETGVVPENKDCVRVTVLKGFWLMTPEADGQVRVRYQVEADPAGDVPAWLANSFVVDQPYHTLLRLRERLGMAQYQQRHFDFVREPPGSAP